MQVSGDENKLYGQLSLGGGTSESGITITSDNSINLTNRNFNHYVEIANDKNYISDVNGFVFVPSPSSKPAGVRIKSFDGTKVLDLAWDSTNETPESPGSDGGVDPYVANSGPNVEEPGSVVEEPSSFLPTE
jgi:hypothetical protein